METTNKAFFDKLKKELEYLEQTVSIQSEPYRYNWQSIPIENNINNILKWIKKNAENSNPEHLSMAFELGCKHLLLLEKYYKNHP
ncbi:MAG: hypothetical protein WAV23_02870 [Minisyncoccia bacterium]